ncbi:DNA polymerase III subunit delta' [Ectothiorhodospiraceae bacterium 2226]|nr:DNA polymerase III subunit delta' [Ectothiorhodospiraceae bacterium 2226]
MNNRLPWHGPAWDRLREAHAQQRLGHALLLTGAQGLGKGRFALRLAAGLLCRSPEDGEACGVCRSCELYAAGTHPDFRLIQPEEKSVITVDQIRALTRALGLTAQLGGARVAVIQPAERMHAAAANALLKTLEEPTRGAYLVLVSDQASGLPATVRSRCQHIGFAAPPAEVARAWLAEQGVGEPAALLAASGGAPLKALAFHEGDAGQWQATLAGLVALAAGQTDPVSLAAGWQDKTTAPDHLQALWRVLGELIRWKAGGDAPAIFGPSERRVLHDWLQRVDWSGLFALVDRTGQALRGVHGGLNPELLLDDLLIAWTRLPRPPQVREAG